MARKVTIDDIKQFNELYYKYKSFAEVARQTGWSAGTVSKYVDKNYTPAAVNVENRVDVSIIPEAFDSSAFKGLDNYGELCVLTDEEKSAMPELWKEMRL